MTGLLIIFVSFAFGIAGGFLAMHFYFHHHEFVEKSRFDTLDSYTVEQCDNVSKIFDSMNFQLDTLLELINTYAKNQLIQETKMDDHYRWSLGIWNDIANAQLAKDNPIPESMEKVLKEEEPISEEDVKPMGPTEEAVDQGKFIQDVVQMLKDEAMESLENDIMEKDKKTHGLEFQQSEMQVVKEGDPIDIKIPDRVKPLRQDKKKKGKK